MKNTDKVTLTFGQLKSLIRESKLHKKVIKEAEENINNFKNSLSHAGRILYDVIEENILNQELDNIEVVEDEYGKTNADYIAKDIYRSIWSDVKDYCGDKLDFDKLKNEITTEFDNIALQQFIKNVIIAICPWAKNESNSIDYDKIDNAQYDLIKVIDSIKYKFNGFANVVSSEVGSNIDSEISKYSNIIYKLIDDTIDAVGNFKYAAGATKD